MKAYDVFSKTYSCPEKTPLFGILVVFTCWGQIDWANWNIPQASPKDLESGAGQLLSVHKKLVITVKADYLSGKKYLSLIYLNDMIIYMWHINIVVFYISKFAWNK